jgi:hypothetical protein
MKGSLIKTIKERNYEKDSFAKKMFSPIAIILISAVLTINAHYTL